MMDGFGFIISLMVSYFSFAMFSFWAMYSMSHYGWNGVHGCGMFSHISTYNNAQLDIIIFFFLLFPSGIRSHGIIKITKSITVDYITETSIKVRTSA
jgi:hypothetical protein